ncbi:dnaJ homolog subfamily B member 13 [Octopus bimaculoides]|uniref:DnaJ homolog subfamily B member 13 n=1 Tax=Octopus bimaculoides TaxID=37653 RepID=A0A0L8HH95_OCTBM|nr:dnaJ homolog subfamily B member 13 [Octopus bimaculoides]|eukprot:XP_014772620.1 PREDICTED: dnaJ homolog subfamily B member 13-like [Octopus bimaculoides]
MGVDYYDILNITRSATDAEIKKSYRKLALLYHPDKTDQCLKAAEMFMQIAEAYEVLSNKQHKAIYDQFGEEGLKNGIPTKGNEPEPWTKGYVFHGDAERVFREFFGMDNPFQEFFDRVDGDLSLSFGGLHGRSQKKKDPPIERDLVLTLEEVYHGCLKKMRISRRVMNDDGHTSSIRDKILNITVRKGWLPDTTIVFPNESDQGPNTIPADIIFTLKDHSHKRFHRKGHDLYHTATVSLEKALTGCIVDISTLDDRILHIPITDVVKPGYTKVVPGEGMPHADNPDKFGNLIINFEIVFPRTLSPDRRIMVKNCQL